MCVVPSLQNPCCVGVFSVRWGRRPFSSEITERWDMGIYEVPLSMYLLDLGWGLC